MNVTGYAYRSGGATSHSPSGARTMLALGLLALGVGDLAIIHQVILPRLFAEDQATFSSLLTLLLPRPAAVSPLSETPALPESPRPTSAPSSSAQAPAARLAPRPLVSSRAGATRRQDPSPQSTAAQARDFPDLFFAFNSAWLSPSARQILDRVADTLTKDPSRRVMLTGYTDDMGTHYLNLALSRERSLRAKLYLQSRGVEQTQIEVKGLGPLPPLEAGSLASARMRNRRVEIAVR